MNQSTQLNIKRKSLYVDNVVLHNDKPLFSFIDINPTELCNRTCEFCPRVDSDIYPNQDLHMDISTAHKIREELEELNWKGSINICGNGEPLLHKDIVGLVRAFGDRIRVEITTNGDFLRVDLIKDLYANHLDYMVISMYDGPEQVNYFDELFNKSNIDKSKYTLRDRWYREDEDYGLILTNRAGTFDWNRSMGISKQCFYMHYSIQIDWNGDVLFCVQDIYGKTRTFGNVNDKSLWDMWESKQMDKYRKLLGKGDRTESPCNKCDASGLIHGYGHYLKWKNI
jgi:radical SAM protein with 4Fe4S-binding SPASM domain